MGALRDTEIRDRKVDIVVAWVNEQLVAYWDSDLLELEWTFGHKVHPTVALGKAEIDEVSDQFRSVGWEVHLKVLDRELQPDESAWHLSMKRVPLP